MTDSLTSADVRGDLRRGSESAARSELLLHGAHDVEADVESLPRAPAHRLQRHPQTRLVTEPRRPNAPVAEFIDAQLEGDIVADRDSFLRLFSERKSGIDPDLRRVQHFALLRRGLPMNRLLTDDAQYRPTLGVNRHAFAQQNRRVDAAERVDEQKSVLVDVPDGEAYLIAVAIEDDFAFRPDVQPEDALGKSNESPLASDIEAHGFYQQEHRCVEELRYVLQIPGKIMPDVARPEDELVDEDGCEESEVEERRNQN